jgi:aspartyl-tRNA(Asn)/glutamyl-tRNA(Gln) amidotransferase subunit A
MLFKDTKIREIHANLVSGKISPADLYNQAYEAITTHNGSINALIESYEYDAYDLQNHALSGIPVAIKDNILFKGKKASAGSKMLENYVASYDSKIAEIFTHLGAVVVGRANMDEFAMGSSTETSYYGPTRNPLDISRVPGGSSGGSAAAVASGMAMYALGSDTGGSIRQPAAYCGLVGLKPSYGAVSRRGLMAMASSLDVIGPITHSVEDAEIVFNAISEYDPLDSTCIKDEDRRPFQEKNINNKIIGVPRAFLDQKGIDPELLENFNLTLDKMKSEGYHIVDIDLPSIHHSLAVYYILQPAEASSNLARYDGVRYGLSEKAQDLIETYKKTKTEGFGDEVRRRIILGTHVLSSGYHDDYYDKAQNLRKLITQEVQNAFHTVDIIATPTSPNIAFKFGEKKDPVAMYLEDIFTVPYNLTGNPAISIPSGLGNAGMPYGMHFTAPMFCEKKLFEAGKDFERVII